MKIYKAINLTTHVKSTLRANYRLHSCPACGPSMLILFGNDETLVRCLRCRGTPVHRSLISVLKELVLNPSTFKACELSSRGALVRYLRKNFSSLDVSEYFDGVRGGEFVGNVQCQDVTSLSYPNDSFDIFTCTEVFEHVANEAAGFKEIQRVLKGSGIFLFTVPLNNVEHTVERAVISGGTLKHLLPPNYHGDRLRGADNVLVFRDYGMDICERLLQAGFKKAIRCTPNKARFGFKRLVIAAFNSAIPNPELSRNTLVKACGTDACGVAESSTSNNFRAQRDRTESIPLSHVEPKISSR